MNATLEALISIPTCHSDTAGIDAELVSILEQVFGGGDAVFKCCRKRMLRCKAITENFMQQTCDISHRSNQCILYKYFKYTIRL